MRDPNTPQDYQQREDEQVPQQEGARSGVVELSDAISVVRDQLIAAQVAGRRTVSGHVVSFGVGKVSIEFTGEMKSTGGVGGGVSFHVFTAEAKADLKGEHSRSSMQKVIVELLPLNPDGSSFKVADGIDTPPQR